MKNLMMPLISLTAIALANVDMYQDSDPNKTVVVIEARGVTKYITVDNSEIDNPEFIDKVERMFYGNAIKTKTRK